LARSSAAQFTLQRKSKKERIKMKDENWTAQELGLDETSKPTNSSRKNIDTWTPVFGDPRGDRKSGNNDGTTKRDIPVVVELGRKWISTAEVSEIQQGSLIELDNDVGATLNVFLDGKNIAEGEIVVIGGRFGVRVTKITNK
jgi:flagellar motor switch protein FliN/FliY